jgi:hypothetical protein
MKLIFATLLTLASLSAAARAAEITLRNDNNSAFIIITGKIEETDDQKFFEVAGNSRRALVVLNSEGGRGEPTMNIGYHVRSHDYDTVVMNGAICHSACPLIWIAGAARYLARHARLGLHSAAHPNTRERNEPGNAWLAKYMKIMGAPQDRQPLADPCCLNFIGYDEVKAWGLLSEPLPLLPTLQEDKVPDWLATQQDNYWQRRAAEAKRQFRDLLRDVD